MGGQWAGVPRVDPDKCPYTGGWGARWCFGNLYLLVSKIIAVNIVYLFLFCYAAACGSASQYSKQQISVFSIQPVPIVDLIHCTYSYKSYVSDTGGK